MSQSIKTIKSKVPIAYLNILIDVTSHFGVSKHQLLWGSGISLNELNDINSTISFSLYGRILKQAILLTGEPGLGFYFGQQLKMTTHGLLGFTASVAASLREAIDIIIKFIGLQTAVFNMILSVEGSNAHLEFKDDFIDLTDETGYMAYEVYTIYLFLGFIGMARSLLGDETLKFDVDFRCSCPNYFPRFSKIIDSTMGNLRFNCKQTQIIFDTSILDQPLVASDPIMFRLLKQQCYQELSALNSRVSLKHEIKKLIHDELTGFRDIKEVASLLCTSPRSLQRALEKNGINFHSLKSDLQYEKAKYMLIHTTTQIEYISGKLGYNDSQSFIRAFRKWSGMTPKQFRNKNI